MKAARDNHLVVGVDTGGTFTDIVYRIGTRSGAYKTLSTPDDPGRAVVAGLEVLFNARRPDLLTYGTTVATNAVLERRGAATALVTTAGFEDVLEIGRQARPRLYTFEPTKPDPLVPRSRRIGVTERTLYDGTRERRPSREELRALADRLRRSGARSIAVCLLHASANPSHEKAVARALRTLGVPVTVSHELAPGAGEYERSSTTVANAYVRPKLEAHVLRLAETTRARRFRVMQSNGGCIGAEPAAREPVRTMMSGPAGGVAAAAACLRTAGIARAITFDMGGTSTDVALWTGTLPRRAISFVGGVPVRSPCLDIHTVGAGGGSIAYVDAGGSLRVGPESAGAVPGPACYGKGDRATVTDANLVLGRIRPADFLGGSMTLQPDRSLRVLSRLAVQMGLRGREAAANAAAGVLEVVEGNMERAVRLITVERGEDPRDCTLMCFGGAAALHGCGLADKIGMRSVLIPADPGLLSARGVMDGPVIRDILVPATLGAPGFGELQKLLAAAATQARAAVSAEGIEQRRVEVEAVVKLRYLGQSIELEVPFTRSFRRDFDTRHQTLFRTNDPQRTIECVGARVTATGTPKPGRTPRPPAATGRPLRERVPMFVGANKLSVPVYTRDALKPGTRITSPAVIVEYSSTVWVAPNWSASVDGKHNLRLERKR